MNVKELMDRLSEFPQDMRVVISGFEGGVNDVQGAAEIEIFLNRNTAWYYGRHEAVTSYDDDKGDESAAIIR